MRTISFVSEHVRRRSRWDLDTLKTEELAYQAQLSKDRKQRFILRGIAVLTAITAALVVGLSHQR
jgi:uncharacterized membrane protein